jgi:hypothetical protein
MVMKAPPTHKALDYSLRPTTCAVSQPLLALHSGSLSSAERGKGASTMAARPPAGYSPC